MAPTGTSAGGANEYLIDTDVIIDALRAHAFFDGLLQRPKICVITMVELWARVKSAKEERALRHLLGFCDKIEVSAAIAEQACNLRFRYGKSHGTDTVDAVIAASAQQQSATLVTLNRKHYPMLENFYVPYEKH